jgi:malonyl-CoA O-methyltransferase
MTTVSPREAYRLLANVYDQHPNPLTALERRILEPLLPALSGLRVIDAGSGTGRWSSYCALQGAQVVSVDLCEEMLALGPKPCVAGDLNRLPFRDSSADLTLCCFALGYARTCPAELRRVTRPGGAVILTDMHPDAIRAGWTRSFRRQSEVIQIGHELYSIDDLEHSGWQRSWLISAKFGEPEAAIFERAGHSARFAEASRLPAIFAGCWIRR